MVENLSHAAPPILGPDIYSEWRASELGLITEALEARLLLELAGDVAGLDVLDVGCGDGELAFALADLGARVIGVDSSDSMIAAARRAGASKTSVSGTSLSKASPVRFECAKGEKLPFESAQYDLVFAKTILCFVDDAPAVFAEISRVLRPGGRLVIGELGTWSFWALQRYVRGLFGSRLWRRGNSWTATQLRELARDAGLPPMKIRGSVFYPRCVRSARVMARFDETLGRRTTLGAAFIALSATKPLASPYGTAYGN
ncbi:MAG: ubiquinone/menaquinone biosynthesis C-methylase UbiE [Alphaproteobacteria bacterium]|jgi:ubiquinone/menaquinone biosynthesis C-methylase UbiE